MKNYVITSIIIILVIMLVPLFWLKLFQWTFGVGEEATLLIVAAIGLVGAILGGAISGSLTLIGVKIGINNERENNLKYRFLEQWSNLTYFEDWIESTDIELRCLMKDPDHIYYDRLNDVIFEGYENLDFITKIDNNLAILLKEYIEGLISVKATIKWEEDWHELEEEVNEVLPISKKILDRFNYISNL